MNAWHKWAQLDLTAMIRRDRDHPSIVLWSVGNEIPEQTKEDGADVLRTLTEICHREDPTRPVTSGCDNIVADGGATTLAFLEQLDIVGYNYVDRWHERRELYYSIDRHDHPNWKKIGTESISNGDIRGAYSLGNDSSAVHADYTFRMINAEQLWKFVRTRDYVIGDFMWTGIDYLGEAFLPQKSASFGVLDLCGFPKDGYYFYQSQWTEKPVIRLFPHWNWAGREEQVIPVLCYTNCDAVELFFQPEVPLQGFRSLSGILVSRTDQPSARKMADRSAENGKSYGEKRVEFPRQGNSGAWNRYDKPLVNPTTDDLHLQWDVPYAPGVLRAVGKKAGKTVCVQEMRTAGKPVTLELSVDRDTVKADARDVAHVEVRVLDMDGNVVPTADNLITFTIAKQNQTDCNSGWA
jgi:beta-galactosidase